ncbi:hypothetical protein [Mumia quercus]|uniref:hypothetical protein n=1 Tax=Mumia quercus TaxID=2976125 RepID=UPI0021D17721|nr:hypothetical protein [Mumia quercus]
MRVLGTRLRKAAVATSVAATLAIAGGAAAEPDSTYPNLPKQLGFGMVGSGTTTLAYVRPSKQWMQLADALVVADTIVALAGNPSCHGVIEPPERCELAPNSYQGFPFTARVFPVTPKKPIESSTFRTFPPVKIRTVAFGTIPATATVELRLRSGADGLPEPLVATTDDDYYQRLLGPCGDCFPTDNYHRISDSDVRGTLDVRLSELVVDGVTMNVGPRCEAKGAVLRGRGEGYFSNQDNTAWRDLSTGEPLDFDSRLGVPVGKYNAALGGVIRATIDVPRFVGCGTGGENLSPLVSSVASGRDFPVVVTQAKAHGLCWNTVPSLIDLGQCPYVGEMPYPTNNG